MKKIICSPIPGNRWPRPVRTIIFGRIVHKINIKVVNHIAYLIQKDNPHYQVCARNREFIADYLQVLDCELVHDPQEHIFRITGDGVLTERMTLFKTTKLVILMKLIYRDKIMGRRTTCHDNQSCGDPKIWKGKQT